MKVVFMGTPGFAVAALQKLVENNIKVVGVITAADKPAGRGRKLQKSAVKQYAESQNLAILQPKNLKSETFLKELENLQADLFVVVAFRMLPAAVFEMPAKGTFNLHASLLPQYRGAAPINWAVINGETETGVTTFFIEKQIDTGKIIHQKKVKIAANETAGTLHNNLMSVGADLVLKTVNDIANETYTITEQDHNLATKKAPKIFKEDCKIDWNKSNKNIDLFIRGLSPYPAAYTFLKEQQLKIYAVETAIETHSLKPGEYLSDNKSYLKFASKDGFIFVKELQLQGKKRMDVKSFLNGYQLANNGDLG